MAGFLDLKKKRDLQTYSIIGAPEELSSAGMERTKNFEGFRETPYRDTVGVPTIGYGFNMQTSKLPSRLSREQADVIFKDYYGAARKNAEGFLTPQVFKDLHPTAQDIVTDMTYNLGKAGIEKFPKFKAALQRGDYSQAAEEMKNSKWFTQVKRRGLIQYNEMRALAKLAKAKPMPKKSSGFLSEAFIKPIKTFYGGTLKASADVADLLDFYSDKIAGKLGIPQTWVFEYLRDNWKTSGERLEKEGLSPGTIKEIYEGLGRAGFDIPVKYLGPGKFLKVATLPAIGAAEGFKEGGGMGAATGAASGAAMHGAFRVLGALPAALKYPAASALFASQETEPSKQVAAAVTAPIFVLGKSPSWKEFKKTQKEFGLNQKGFAILPGGAEKALEPFARDVSLDIPTGASLVLRSISGEKVPITRKPGEEITAEPVVKEGVVKYVKIHDGEEVKVNKNVAQDLINKYGVKKESLDLPAGVEEVVKGVTKAKKVPSGTLPPKLNWRSNPAKTEWWSDENFQIVKADGKYYLYYPDGESVLPGDYWNTLDAAQQRAGLESLRWGKETTKYSQYQLPGGENYREVLIKAGDTGNKRFLELRDLRREVGLTKVEEKEFQKYYKDGAEKEFFTSSHWDEPNVLAHIRMNDRTTPDGKKVLFIEELQSDWAKEVRKSETKVIDSADRNQDPEFTGTSHPLLKNWQELALKRVLKEAVDGGYDYISWTTGEQQAERYDLSKQVNSIAWDKNADGTYKVVATTRRSAEPMGDISPEKLPTVIGKDAAQKILEGEETGILRAKDLKIGGEWAKNLYDRQVPNILKDLTKGGIKNISFKSQKKESQKPISLDGEYSFAIGDYVDNVDDFGDAEIAQIKAEIKKDLPPGVKLADFYFNDIDSANISHASGYITIRLEGPETLTRRAGFNLGITDEGIPNGKIGIQPSLAITPELRSRFTPEPPPEFKSAGAMASKKPRGEPPDKIRSFIMTVKGAEKTAPEVAETIMSRYTPLGNKAQVAEAHLLVESDLSEAYRLANIENPPIAELAKIQVVSEVLMIKAQEAGNWAEAKRLTELMAKRFTSSGQASQVAAIYERLSPEGVLRYADNVFKEAMKDTPEKLLEFQKLSGEMTEAEKVKLAREMKIPYLSEELMKKLYDRALKIRKVGVDEAATAEFRKEISDTIYESVKAMPYGRHAADWLASKVAISRMKAMDVALLMKDISSEIPKEFWSKVSLVQTIAQLLNPKTMIRNFLGSEIFWITENLADTVGAMVDIALSLKTGKRTIYLPNLVTQFQGGKEGLLTGVTDALLGINLGRGLGSKLDIPQNSLFDGGILGGLEKGLGVTMRAIDQMFYMAAKKDYLTQHMKAAGVEEPTFEMIEKAHQLGLYRTFNDDNALSGAFVKLKNALNWFTKPWMKGKWGAGDMVIKYAKTPASLIARGIEYSPLAFTSTIYEAAAAIKTGGKKFDQEALVKSFSRGGLGSLAIGTGAILLGLGIITGGEEKDREVTELQKSEGIGKYKINITALKRFALSGMDPKAAELRNGDTLVSYDWLLPGSISIAVGANIMKAVKESASLKEGAERAGVSIADAVLEASNTIMEQPLISNLQRLTRGDNIVKAIANLGYDIPASFVPTLLNQVKQLTDNVSRNTQSPNYFMQAYNKVAYKVPILSKTLEPNISVFGKEKEIYPGSTNNPFNVFLNPAFVSKYNPPDEAKLVLDIWKETGETSHFPRKAPKSIQMDGKKRVLTPEEQRLFQSYIGNKTGVLFNILYNDPTFMKDLPENRVKKLAGFLTDIYTAAKIEVLGYRPKKTPGNVVAILKDLQGWWKREAYRREKKEKVDRGFLTLNP